MKVTLLAVGKRHNAALDQAITDYTTRLQRRFSVSWQFVPAPHAKMSSDQQKTAESTTLLAQLQPRDVVVLLDERGTQLSTPQLARVLADYIQQAAPRVVFVIGGAYGVDERLAKRANLAWSLGKLVFPHQLVRLILAEQLYRAATILHGEPYHHQ